MFIGYSTHAREGKGLDGSGVTPQLPLDAANSRIGAQLQSITYDLVGSITVKPLLGDRSREMSKVVF